jgi:HAD superfamily hydrolase (TIGR01490 family)
MRPETGSSVYVFCDVDETLINCKSMFDFLHFYLAAKHGEQGARRAERTRRESAAMAAAGVPRERANREYYRVWKGESAAEVERAAERWWAERSAEPGFLIAATEAELERHRAAGARIVLVSGSFPAVLDPVALHVGASRVLCTRPEARAGVFTGRVEGAPMIGEAKREAVRAVLRADPAADPARCFGYGDHHSDLPMLSEVGQAVVVGGDAGLLRDLPRARVLTAR